jgi:hypothetical protein
MAENSGNISSNFMSSSELESFLQFYLLEFANPSWLKRRKAFSTNYGYCLDEDQLNTGQVYDLRK